MSLSLLPVKQAAAKLGVSVTLFNQWRKDPRGSKPLPRPRLVCGRKMWSSADLDDWIAGLPVTEPREG